MSSVIGPTCSATMFKPNLCWGNPKRQRRDRIAFFGESKLRSEICPGDMHQVCARCAAILAEEISQPVAHSAPDPFEARASDDNGPPLDTKM